MDGVEECIGEVEWWGHVVRDSGSSKELSGSLLWLPNTEDADQNVICESRVQHLRNQEDVGAQGRLKHDGHVAGIEKTNRESSSSSTLTAGFDWNLDTETLEIDDCGEDNESCEKVGDVGKVLSVESLLQRAWLVAPGKEKVEESNNSSLKLGSSSSVDCSWAECSPDDVLTDVGSNEKLNTGTQSVALLEKLIEKNDNKTSNDKLENEQQANTSTEVTRLTVKSSQNVNSGLSEGEDDSEELLGSLIKLAIRLEVKVNVDEVSSGKKLENHARRYDRRDTQFHQCTSVTGQHHSEPVERI